MMLSVLLCALLHNVGDVEEVGQDENIRNIINSQLLNDRTELIHDKEIISYDKVECLNQRDIKTLYVWRVYEGGWWYSGTHRDRP